MITNRASLVVPNRAIELWSRRSRRLVVFILSPADTYLQPSIRFAPYNSFPFFRGRRRWKIIDVYCQREKRWRQKPGIALHARRVITSYVSFYFFYFKNHHEVCVLLQVQHNGSLGALLRVISVFRTMSLQVDLHILQRLNKPRKREHIAQSLCQTYVYMNDENCNVSKNEPNLQKDTSL